MSQGDERGRGSRARRVVVALLLTVFGVLVAVIVDRDAPIAPAAAPPPAKPAKPAKSAVESSPRHRASAIEPAPDVESPAPLPSATASPVSGRVIDSGGAPIGGAEVTLFADAGRRVIASNGRRVERVTTAADGAFSFADGGRRAPELVARCAGFETRSVVVGRPRDAAPLPPVEIRLRAGGAVVGRVRLANGEAPRVPVRVMVGWPVDVAPEQWTRLEKAEASLGADARVLAAVTDADGNFRIDGLRDRSWCTLRAGGPCLACSSSSLVEAEAGGAAVEIVVAPLFAFDVRVVAPDGESPDTSPYLRAPGVGLSWSGPYPQQMTYSTGSPELRWAGVPDSSANDPLHVFAVYPVDSTADRIGPFRFTARIPGYRLATAEVWAQRVTDAPVAKTEIRLEPAVTEFGTLTIRIDDHGTGFAKTLRALDGNVASLRVPQVLLAYAPGQALGSDVVPRMAVPLWTAAERPTDIRGLAVGTYVAAVDIPLGARSIADTRREIHIAPDGAYELVVDVAEWAGLALGVDLGADAPPYRGSAEVTVRRSGSKESYKVNLRRSPFYVVGMQPGTYEVAVTQLMRATMEPFTVELKPNVVTPIVRPATTIAGPMSSRR